MSDMCRCVVSPPYDPFTTKSQAEQTPKQPEIGSDAMQALDRMIQRMDQGSTKNDRHHVAGV